MVHNVFRTHYKMKRKREKMLEFVKEYKKEEEQKETAKKELMELLKKEYGEEQRLTPRKAEANPESEDQPAPTP